jgi:hypothetical protein
LSPLDPTPPAPDAGREGGRADRTDAGDPAVLGLLLDHLRGELAPEEARRLDRRLAADPGLEARRAGLARLLEAARAFGRPQEDPALAARLVARIRAEDAAERSRTARGPHRRRRFALTWPRVIAVSLAVHVVLLAVLTVRAREADRAAGAPLLRAQLPGEQAAFEPRVPEGAPSPWAPEERGLPETHRLLAGLLPPGTPPPPDEDLAPLEERRRDLAPGAAQSMILRTDLALRRLRLDGLGLNADGTLAAVARGLDALARRQAADGSFGASGGRGVVGETALALLPFLGDGHGSASEGPGHQVVARGVAFLRGRVFTEAGDLTSAARALPVVEAGVLLKTLSEDYMLSYGRLLPGAARRRAEELRVLAAHVADQQGPTGGFGAGAGDVGTAVWPMWGLDAVARTGVTLPPAVVATRFAGWYAREAPREDPRFAAAGLLLARDLGPDFETEARAAADVVRRPELHGEIDPLFVATAGAGLLLYDAAAFRAWSAGLGERLLQLLGPNGVVHRGDVVGDTALVLLALQAAYRIY